jgi:molecular chaperone GrpE
MRTIHPLFRIPDPPEDLFAPEPEAAEIDELKEQISKLGRLHVKTHALLEARLDDSAPQEEEPLLAGFLRVLDGLDQTIAALEDETDDRLMQSKEGLALVLQKGLDALSRRGIKPIAALGEPFDPKCHVAMDTVSMNDLPDRVVIEEERRGYRRGDKVVRPAEVVVNKIL